MGRAWAPLKFRRGKVGSIPVPVINSSFSLLWQEEVRRRNWVLNEAFTSFPCGFHFIYCVCVRIPTARKKLPTFAWWSGLITPGIGLCIDPTSLHFCISALVLSSFPSFRIHPAQSSLSHWKVKSANLETLVGEKEQENEKIHIKIQSTVATWWFRSFTSYNCQLQGSL